MNIGRGSFQQKCPCAVRKIRKPSARIYSHPSLMHDAETPTNRREQSKRIGRLARQNLLCPAPQHLLEWLRTIRRNLHRQGAQSEIGKKHRFFVSATEDPGHKPQKPCFLKLLQEPFQCIDGMRPFGQDLDPKRRLRNVQPRHQTCPGLVLGALGQKVGLGKEVNPGLAEPVGQLFQSRQLIRAGIRQQLVAALEETFPFGTAHRHSGSERFGIKSRQEHSPRSNFSQSSPNPPGFQRETRRATEITPRAAAKAARG